VINPVILNFFNFCQSKGKCSGGKDIWPGVNLANAAPGAANSVDAVRFSNNINSMIVKVDHALSKNHQLSGRYFFGDSTQSFPLGLAGGNNLPGTNTVAPIRTQLVSVSLVSTLSTNVVNEARFGWNRYRNGFYPEDASLYGNPNSSLGLDTGVTNSRDFGLPTMRFGTLSFLGSSPFSNPRDRVDQNYQVIDGLSWKRGRHDIKFGYEFRETTVRSFNNFSSRGVFAFNALSNFLTGTPTGTTLFGAARIIQGTTDRNAKQGNDGLYVQDSFRWTKNFTLNLGLRWDYFGVIHEDQGRLSVYDPAVGLVRRDPLYNKDFRSFSPRTSVAWDVTGKQKTVVRAGFGVFFDDFSQDAFTGQIYANSFNAGVAYNAIGPDPIFLNKSLTRPLFQPNVPIFAPVNFNGPAPGATQDASTVDRNLRNPYVYNFNLNVQQELFRNTVFQIGYVGSSGHKLLRLRDINQPTHAVIRAADLACTCILDSGAVVGSAPRNFSTPLSAIAPNPPFVINQLEGSAVSHYHSLQTSLTQQNFHGWTNQITYTWSHSIDTASDSQDYVPNAAESQDGTNTNAEKGPSNFDLRNRFVWSSSYNLPKWEAGGRMGEGWMLSGVLTIASGHPFSMNYNATDDYSGSGSFVDRPDVVGPLQYDQDDPTRYLNLNAFAIPCTPNGTGTGFAFDSCTPGTRHFGNLGRNGLIGPNYRNFDLAISKETRITERLKLVFRVDAYNLLNHPNLASPLAVAFFADAAPNRSAAFPSGVDPATGRHVGNLAITATSDVGVGNPVLGGGGTRSLQLAVRLQF
jgi:hypothetical protein